MTAPHRPPNDPSLEQRVRMLREALDSASRAYHASHGWTGPWESCTFSCRRDRAVLASTASLPDRLR